MTIWIDAQLSPAIPAWISETFAVSAVALRDLELRDATDCEIFLAAKRESAIVMTKDSDFLRLLEELGLSFARGLLRFGLQISDLEAISLVFEQELTNEVTVQDVAATQSRY